MVNKKIEDHGISNMLLVVFVALDLSHTFRLVLKKFEGV